MQDIDHEDFERIVMSTRLRVRKGINFKKAELLAKRLVSEKFFHNDRQHRTNFTPLVDKSKQTPQCIPITMPTLCSQPPFFSLFFMFLNSFSFLFFWGQFFFRGGKPSNVWMTWEIQNINSQSLQYKPPTPCPKWWSILKIHPTHNTSVDPPNFGVGMKIM